MCCPSGCHAGFEASPSPVVSRTISVPSIFILYICCGPERPDTKTISFPVLGLTLGSTSTKRRMRQALQITAIRIRDIDLRVTASKR